MKYLPYHILIAHIFLEHKCHSTHHMNSVSHQLRFLQFDSIPKFLY